jgi:hypothetical protein
MGVDAIRMYQDPWTEKSAGKTTANETKYCVVGEDGSSIAIDLEPAPQEEAGNAINSWSSTQTRTVKLKCANSNTYVSATATASFISYVSQDDANTQATALATQKATVATTEYTKTC